MDGARDAFTLFVGIKKEIKKGFVVVFGQETVDILAIGIVTSVKHKLMAAIKLLPLTKLGAGRRGTEVAS